MLILNCSQTCTDAGRLCGLKMLQGLKGAYIHSFMAVCHIVDVYLDRKSDASCVCDPKCLCFKCQGKIDVHTWLRSEGIGAAHFLFFFFF